MQSFLEEVFLSLQQKEGSLENFVFVLPSKRAGTFLKDIMAKNAKITQFLPKIYSVESFVEEISGLSQATHTQQIFNLYEAYTTCCKGEKDSFYAFSKWGNTLLQDFNEIDRFLIDPNRIFSHLKNIQEINHWSLEKESNEIIDNYLSFWNSLKEIYNCFNLRLKELDIGHQGMIYKLACNNLESYLSTIDQNYVFIGFNALNASEENIIQDFLKSGRASIYWDIDPYFLNDVVHDASHFIRKYSNKWPHFKEKPLFLHESRYFSKKIIEIIGVPKNVSQAKYVGNLLGQLNISTKEINGTALVLGDETLLNPILNSIPEEVKGINITMGFQLNKTPLESFFSSFFELFLKQNQNGWYYQHIISLLNHPYLYLESGNKTNTALSDIIGEIKKGNWIYVDSNKIRKVAQNNKISEILFFEQEPNPLLFIEKCIALIQEIKSGLNAKENALELEHLYRFYQIFQQLEDIIAKYPVIEDLQSLFGLYKEILANETLDFRGEPLKGLQIMGMLESRNLDFETVILTSVNEGILPSGKSNNSFIPFDLKKQYNLPTYKEKDAVYTYHFYRLLQRAKNIYILYNTEPDVLEGGEKSRLIRQLLADENISGNITEKIAYPEIKSPQGNTITIDKNEHLLGMIEQVARKGFSPSSLSNYIRNPISFYKQSLLKINELNEVEETVAANTFGTIVHETLDELYRPFISTVLSPEKLRPLISLIPRVTTKHFNLNYANTSLKEGKNLIVFNVIVKYIENFIFSEIELSKKHNIKIIGLEAPLKIELNYPELSFPIVLKGKLDRIDEFDGVLRIIDYKTGKVEAKDLKITEWNQITETYDKSKAFQLLCYAYMYNQSNKAANSIEAGIFSFKNLKAGILKFKNDNETRITSETLLRFEEKLKALIIEICNSNIQFVEKEV